MPKDVIEANKILYLKKSTWQRPEKRSVKMLGVYHCKLSLFCIKILFIDLKDSVSYLWQDTDRKRFFANAKKIIYLLKINKHSSLRRVQWCNMLVWSNDVALWISNKHFNCCSCYERLLKNIKLNMALYISPISP